MESIFLLGMTIILIIAVGMMIGVFISDRVNKNFKKSEIYEIPGYQNPMIFTESYNPAGDNEQELGIVDFIELTKFRQKKEIEVQEWIKQNIVKVKFDRKYHKNCKSINMLNKWDCYVVGFPKNRFE